jgi:uncharacterized protein (TIGR00251 family)
VETTDWRTAMHPVAEDAVCLDLYANPGSSTTGLGPYDPWRQRIHVQVESPAISGRANRELIGLLADLGDVPKAQVQVVRGATTRRKTVRLDGVDVDVVEKTLSEVLAPAGETPR